MFLDPNKRPKNRKVDNATLIQLLEDLNTTELDSWQEGNFSYSFLRLGNKVNTLSSYFLKATNLDTNEERVIRIPASIESGREALNWATFTE
ncbi:hypothetical protein IQ255_10960 [Pleurocapsales cyanobacterium LEGE 10410]|nr:hypothetical protein [Pleurocapsales cyanobacterium LEGE 10410]